MLGNCDKCDNYVAAPVKLIGQYMATLCNQHRNEFHLYMKGHKERNKFDAIATKLEYATKNKSKRKALKLLAKYRKQEDVLYAISEQWVKELQL